MQTAGPDPKRMTIAPAQLTAPGEFVVLPVFGAAPSFPFKVFEITTAIAVQWPRSTVTLQAGGRTGPPTVTWCPGRPPPTASYNPGCSDPYAFGGMLRYVRTANQFGGPARAALQGVAQLAFRAFGTPPCNFATTRCSAIFAHDSPPPTGVIGGRFGVSNSSFGPPPDPGVFQVAVTTNGLITSIAETGWGSPGIVNRLGSWGAPWTTGQIVVSATNSVGSGPSWMRFTLTGSDNRASGVGNLSLVAGGLSVQTVSGHGADRGWLNLTVPEPAAALGAACALLLLVILHRIVCIRCRQPDALTRSGPGTLPDTSSR